MSWSRSATAAATAAATPLPEIPLPQRGAPVDKHCPHIARRCTQTIGSSARAVLAPAFEDEPALQTALGDMVADSMEWYTQKNDVDFAIQNGGGIRTDLPEGEIEKGTIYEVLPFDNSVMVLTMKGEDVQKLFDYIATIPRGEGAFPQVSDSVEFTINYNEKTCENIRINGEPIDPEATYKVATNSYMAAGGDGYSMFKNAMNSYDTSMFQRDVFIEYVKHLGGTVSPDVDNRIELIGSTTSLLLGTLRPAA